MKSSAMRVVVHACRAWFAVGSVFAQTAMRLSFQALLTNVAIFHVIPTFFVRHVLEGVTIVHVMIACAQQTVGLLFRHLRHVGSLCLGQNVILGMDDNFHVQKLNQLVERW